jgi:hypothetical protein
MADEIVLHTALRYKPDEAKDTYVKLYLETVSGDVLIEKNITNETIFSEESSSISSASETTLTEVIEKLVDSINRRAYTNLFTSAEALYNDDPILKPGQIAFESDTGKFKVGNGTDSYRNLEYFFIPS